MRIKKYRIKKYKVFSKKHFRSLINKWVLNECLEIGLEVAYFRAKHKAMKKYFKHGKQKRLRKAK